MSIHDTEVPEYEMPLTKEQKTSAWRNAFLVPPSETGGKAIELPPSRVDPVLMVEEMMAENSPMWDLYRERLEMDQKSFDLLKKESIALHRNTVVYGNENAFFEALKISRSVTGEGYLVRNFLSNLPEDKTGTLRILRSNNTPWEPLFYQYVMPNLTDRSKARYIGINNTNLNKENIPTPRKIDVAVVANSLLPTLYSLASEFTLQNRINHEFSAEVNFALLKTFGDGIPRAFGFSASTPFGIINPLFAQIANIEGMEPPTLNALKTVDTFAFNFMIQELMSPSRPIKIGTDYIKPASYTVTFPMLGMQLENDGKLSPRDLILKGMQMAASAGRLHLQALLNKIGKGIGSEPNSNYTLLTQHANLILPVNDSSLNEAISIMGTVMPIYDKTTADLRTIFSINN
jgi:hypothetical protein